MAYFLKKTKQKNRTYLAIYESFYSHSKKGTAHKTFKSLGSIETLIKSGIEDPITFYQEEVATLNNERVEAKMVKISESSPLRYLGYFPLNSILIKLNIKGYIDLYKHTTNFKFDLYSVLSSLIFSRAIMPCSKQRTYEEVIPYLFNKVDYSYNQLMTALSFYGSNYQKIIELFTHQVIDKYGIDIKKTYFDCTNFYFEIDKEDELRRKGPSKENSKDPIVGMGLLLDANQIPIGMKLYPGNQSEKPILREVIDNLKRQNNVSGKTIHVADKGLNCIDNIVHSLQNNDGYLFSKSVKMLSEVEKTWVTLDNDWHDVVDKNNKVIYKYKSCIEEFPYTYRDENGKNKNITLREKRLVTYNFKLARKKKAEINKQVEKAMKLCLSQAKKSEYGDSSKYANFNSVDKEGKTTGKVKVSINQKKIDKDILYAGYNMLVTSEINMSNQDMYDTYHNLWRIEESFKIMKSDLDARPVYVHETDAIKGHFLICYLTVLLERIFQFKELNNEYSTNEITEFIKKMKLVKTDDHYLNLTTNSTMINDLAIKYSLPIDNYILSETKLKKVLNFRL